MTERREQKVVIIGGGTGLSVLLRGLKKHPIDLTAIVTVADDGGSSGRLRDELNIPPPGDIRNVLAALSDVEPLVETLFQHRFSTKNELSGHSLGNLMIAALTSITGDFVHAVQEMSKVLNVRGKVLPAANQSVVLHAEMEDGTIVSGESKIPYSGKRIKRVFLSPDKIQPLPETIRAIREADLIIVGPGSLYTSILPNLLVPQIGEEVCLSNAKKVYICNLMTQAGETLDFTASDHVKAIYDHMSCAFMDTILVNNEPIPEHIQEKYKEEMAKPVFYDVDLLKSLGLNVIFDEIVIREDGVVRHDTNKVADILFQLIQDKK
ncbi:uridine diphosphate-N-acetylglucosamine-binding protein YvcK [Bacillus aerolatus]|uniref:Gluconeogenesis factor n=1 Tax=Bacillus aerolatus TaxID=2653354 RepID=A0A6I1FKM2_9BACI|nr:YvcK family protein [Bacillus aerolatus]KAB7704183.1 uridine diphosphate-N-acetylglucosamine-binding protein YvcK [Bacillus aerolatus]